MIQMKTTNGMLCIHKFTVGNLIFNFPDDLSKFYVTGITLRNILEHDQKK